MREFLKEIVKEQYTPVEDFFTSFHDGGTDMTGAFNFK